MRRLDSDGGRYDIPGMRLPDSFLDEIRARLSLSQVAGRKVVWDMRKTNQAKGDWWAPCPFHQEKSASFHVLDQKGFYYCFGCQAKGNVFGFVQETENVGFMEAVEILAREAGLQMPARDPKAAEAADRRSELAAVTEAAAKWFGMQLRAKAAADARAYLDRRGLAAETVKRFEIGFAPSEPDALTNALLAKDIPFETIEAAGLALTEEDGRRRDRFIGRIMFPIRDARDRVIGFGGRAMNPNAKAKYLNSPETELFDKGANLYNLRAARAAVGQGQPLVVAEGYMDVIALAQAGFEGAVAPLGTAVTERQLQLLWRAAPEPLVALDGDAAGQKAGLRVADLALPLIEAGQSLRFAVLPEGRDPDDLIRAEGPAAMRRVLDDAVPMLTLLWRRATEGRSFDSPERRAMLDQELRALLGRVEDRSLRKHYGQEVARLRAALLDLPDVQPVPPAPEPPSRDAPMPQDRWEPDHGPEPMRHDAPPRRSRPRRGQQPLVAGTTRASELAREGFAAGELHEAVILVGLAGRPELIEGFVESIEAVEWTGPGHADLAHGLLRLAPDGGAHLGEGASRTLDRLRGRPHLTVLPVARPDAEPEAVRRCVGDAFARLSARRGAERERREALEDFADGGDETLTWRLAQATRRRDEAARVSDAMRGEAGEQGSFASYYDDLLATALAKKGGRK